ncbi:MAG: TonB family protein [Desulfuromusa sp.]|nr:TonB family protein [Desulfuromusa sp.]
MNLLHSTKPERSRDRPRLLVLSLLLSIVLHLLLVLVLPLFQQQDKLQPLQQQPTIVHLVDSPAQTKKPQPEKPREFEIDQQPVTPLPKIPVESFRQAERDQKVDQEQAPKGEDVRDQTTKPPIPTLPPQQKQKPQDKLVQKQPQKNVPKTTRPVKEQPLEKVAEKPTAPVIEQPEIPKSLPPLLSPEQLRPDFSTLDKIARGSQADRNRSKERKDVEIGDTVWLNLQHNLLISFFRRFHDQIELVWNYPNEAAMNGIEGTLQLEIIVNKKGELLDVDLMRTSGSDLLDFEAIQAVYRAAPYGPLTKHYPHDKLKIRANFSYRLSGQAIFGR